MSKDSRVYPPNHPKGDNSQFQFSPEAAVSHDPKSNILHLLFTVAVIWVTVGTAVFRWELFLQILSSASRCATVLPTAPSPPVAAPQRCCRGGELLPALCPPLTANLTALLISTWPFSPAFYCTLFTLEHLLAFKPHLFITGHFQRKVRTIRPQ